MFNWFLITLAVLLFLFSVLDLWIHKSKSIERGIFGRVFLCTLVSLCLSMGYFGINGIINSKPSGISQKYMAIKYLETEKIEQARKYIKALPDVKNSEKYHKALLGMIADGKVGRYSSVIEASRVLKNTTHLSENQAHLISKLSDLSQKALDSRSEPTEHDKAVIKFQSGLNDVTREVEKEMKVRESDKWAYDAIFTLDEAITSEIFTSETEQLADQLIENSDREDCYRAVIKYYFTKGDLSGALEVAKTLVEMYPTVENQIVYTDIIAQQVRTSSIVPDYGDLENDKEVQKLISEADQLEIQQEVFDKLIDNEKNQEKKNDYMSKKGELSNKIEHLKKEASFIPVRRAINFLKRNSPLLGDRTGIINMQIAKLYFAMDDIEKSRLYLHKVLSEGVSSNSVIKDEISDINDALESSQNTGIPSESLFEPAVNSMINKVSQNIASVEEEGISSEFRNSVVSELKYNSLQIHISKVDSANFPNVKAYVNISGKKNNLWGFANDYEWKDFLLTDTHYKVEDFKLTKNETEDGANIALVLDNSGSMEGRAFEDAKLAVLSCLDKKGKNEKFSVVTYSDTASVINGLSRDADALKNSINLINYPVGGTNISDGLRIGIETLESATGTKALILLSDGMDNRSEEGSLDKVLAYAKDNEIAIFTVGLGEVDESYMSRVAEQTGGAFFKAGNTAQLYDIYRLLQKYIVNNYVFEYKINKNPEVQVRRCDILLRNEGVSGSKFYKLGGEAIPEDEESYSAFYEDSSSLWIEQVSPSSMAVSKIGKNTKIRITGKNFDKDMAVMIGSYYSEKVNVISSTEAEVLLPKALTPGFYAITIENPDGSRKTNEMAFSLFKPGVAKKIRVGSVEIEANAIGQTDATTFIASGNVIINGFLRSSSDVSISANTSFKLDYSDAEVIDLAPTGTISGSGKLYASYSKIKEDGSKNNFAAVALSGKDYVVKNGKYVINANNLDASFDNNQGSLFKLKLPGIIDLTVGEATILSDGIEIKAYDGSNLALLNAVSEKLGGSSSNHKSQAAILKVSKGITSFPLEELSFKIAKEDILVKAGVKIEAPIKLFVIEGTELSLKVDTISGEEWVSVVGNFDFNVNIKKMSAIEMEISTYRLSLNKIGIAVQSGNGIALDPYRIISIFQIGGGVDNIAKGLKEFEIFFKADAGVKVSSILGINSEHVPESLGNLNELLMLNITDLRIKPISKASMKCDINVFGTKMKEVEVLLSKEGCSAIGKVALDVSFIGTRIHMTGRDEIYFGNRGLYKSISGDIKRFKTPFIDVRNQKGLIAFSVANSRFMMETSYQNEYEKIVFDFSKGIWGLINSTVNKVN